jgi:hypothetical protein
MQRRCVQHRQACNDRISQKYRKLCTAQNNPVEPVLVAHSRDERDEFPPHFILEIAF